MLKEEKALSAEPDISNKTKTGNIRRSYDFLAQFRFRLFPLGKHTEATI